MNNISGISLIRGTSGSSTPSETTLKPFEPDKDYKANQAIVVDGVIYTAKSDFTSGNTFDDADWTKVGVSEAELDGKLDKSDDEDILYGTDEDGNQTTVSVADFEKVANKTATISDSGEATDTKYPTEKAARTELDKKADKIVTPHIDWNPNSFSIPAGRVLKFNTDTVPALSGTELPTIAVFTKINGDPDNLLGFYSNDYGATTQAGVFHINDDMTAFEADILLYDGTAWLNDGNFVLPYDISGDWNEYIGDDTALSGFDLHTDITVLDVPVMNLTDVYEVAKEGRDHALDALTEITQEAAVRGSGDNDLQSQIDAMQGQTRRFFVDFDADFGTDTPAKAMTDAWLAARTPALTPNVGTAFKNSNNTQSTYNHLFVYYTDPLDSEQLVLQDDGVDTVSTASDTSLGVVRGAGDVRVTSSGDMKLREDTATDTVIGNRTLEDNAGNSTLVSITAKNLKAWLQGLRDNIKALFTTKVDKTSDASKVYGTDTDGEQTEYDVDSFGKVDTVNGIPADANKNVQTTYTFETEAEFEAAKDSIPIGATVILMYEYPENFSGCMAVPDYAKMEGTNRISFTNKTWTVEKDGYVYLAISFGSTLGGGLAGTDFLINGKRVMAAIWNSNQNASANGEFSVKKGDVITLSGYLPDTPGQYDGVSCYFIPVKFILTQNAVTVLKKYTPYAGLLMGQPDYSNQETVNRTPETVLSWTCDRDGYVSLTGASANTADRGTWYINGKTVYIPVPQPRIDTVIIPLSKGDVVSRNEDSKWLPQATGSCYFIPPKNVPNLFVEGADMQSSSDIGKANINPDDKTMSINGEIGTGTNGIQYSISRPDLWANGVEINFGQNLFGYRTQGTQTSTSADQVISTDIMPISTPLSTFKLLSMGGNFDAGNGYCQSPIGSTNLISGFTNCGFIWLTATNVVLRIKTGTVRTDAQYDVWFTYKK
jgi:hypothetical protein